MAGCKRCGLKGGKREKEEKRKGKRRKNGDQIYQIFKYIRKTVSRLSRSYPLLFAIKILMVSQFGDL